MLNIYYGPESINKENFIFSSINSPGTDENSKTIILVPDQFSLQMEKAALKFSQSQNGKKALMNLIVTDFSALGHKVVKEVDCKDPELIDKYGRHMLLALIVERLANKNELSIYAGMKGKNTFVSSANQLISEMKRYSITADNLMDTIKDTDSYLKLKLADIAKIFDAYEKSIENQFLDSEDYVKFYGALMEESALIEGADVWVYGFDTFSPLHMEIMRSILRRAKSLNVVITCETEDSAGTNIKPNDGSKLDARSVTLGGGDTLFSLSNKVISNLVDIAKSIGDTSDVINLADISGIVNKKSIWNSDVQNKIKLSINSNVYAEADKVAAYICELVREKEYRYSDIAVICNEMETRGGILLRAFSRWGIPAFADKKRQVLHQPVVRFLLSLLDIISGGYDSNAIMRLVSTGLLGWERESIELLANYIDEAKIRKNKWKKPFTWVDKSEFGSRYSDEDLVKLNEMRSFIVDICESAKDDMGRRNKAREKVSGLYDFLNSRFGIEEKIEELIDRQESLELAEGAAESAQSWGIICEIFEQIARTIGDEQISYQLLKEIIVSGFEEMQIGLVPVNNDCVIVGTMQRTRISSIKCLIVTVANEGILPLTPSDSGLLTDRELGLLEDLKLSVAKREEVRQQEEQLGIYRMFSLPEDELFVSCSLADQDGGSILPSRVFETLSEISAKDIEGDLGKAGPIEMISGNNGSLTYMAEAMRHYLETGQIQDEWIAAMDWYAENNRESITKISEGMNFDNRVIKLEEDLANALYFGNKDHINVSASRLEKYAGCPFKYFVDAGLKAEESRKFEIDARSRGDVYHEALQVLAKRLTPDDGTYVTSEESRWMTISREECQNEIAQIISDMALGYREGVYVEDNSGKFQLEKSIENCSDMAWAMIEQVRKSNTKAMYLEEPFGFEGSILKPIRISLRNGKKAILNGRIDRIDVLEAQAEIEPGIIEPVEKIRVIDYKTGNNEIDIEHMRKGYKLQLMIYMDAINNGKLEPAGAFYFKINELDIDADKEGTPEEKGESVEHRITKNCRLEGIFVDDPGVLQAMDSSLKEEKKSITIPVRKDGEGLKAYTPSAILSQEEFNELCEISRKQVEQICLDIQEGKIDIAPKREAKNSGKSGAITACTYCQYKSICLFDTSFDSCRYIDV